MAKAEQGGQYGGKFSSTLSISILLCFFFQSSTAYLFKLTVEKFVVSALREKSTHNSTIHFDLELRNFNDQPIYYDALNITFYYKSNSTNFLIGNAFFPAFYQRKLDHDHRVGDFKAIGVKLENVTTALSIFRVQVASSLRFGLRNSFFKSRRSHYVVGADLKVNDEGNLVNKGVQLKSRAGKIIKSPFEMVGILLGVFIFLHSW